MKHLYPESYRRRENLQFFGIPEKEANAEESGEAFDTRAVLNQFLDEPWRDHHSKGVSVLVRTIWIKPANSQD